MSSGPRESEWERGWDGHERAQRRRLARLPFTEKLRWLEEAHDLVGRLQGRNVERDPPSAHEDMRDVRRKR